ncbi:hypothetical protein VTO73DRAFT_3308 [Trametes versicolor]
MTYPDYGDCADYPPGHPLHRAPPPAPSGPSSRGSRDGPWSPPPGPHPNRDWDSPPSFGPPYGSGGGGGGPSGPSMGWNQPPGNGPSGPPMGWSQQQGYSSYGQGGMPYQQSMGPGPDTWMVALQAQSENTQLTRELGDVRLQLQEAQFHLDRLQSDYDHLQREVQEVRAERANLQAEVQRLRTNLTRGRPPSMDRVDEGRRERRSRARRSLSPREDRRATSPAKKSPRPLQQRLSDAPAVPLAERIQPPPATRAPSLRDRLAPQPANPRGRRSPEDVHMIEDRPRGADATPGGRAAASAQTDHAPRDAQLTPAPVREAPRPATPTSPRGSGLGTAQGAPAPKKPQPHRAVPEITRVPHTVGLDIREVDALRHQSDPALDASPQPKSAWYLRWVSIKSMPDAADDDYISGDELAEEGQSPELDCPLPDPVAARRRDMTDVAESKEAYCVHTAENRASDAVSEGTLLAEFSRSIRDLGAWAGTTIQSVVQAHNLRWWATVEFEPLAVEYLKAVRRLYSHPHLRRSAGVRYLMQTAEADLVAIHCARRPAPPAYYPARDNNSYLYPPPSATPPLVARYYRNVPTRYWHTSIRLADGSTPSHSAQEYGLPNPHDAYGAFISKHTQAPPPGRPSEAVRKLSIVLRNGIVALFALPGLYRHICELGGYFVHPRRPPASYPFENADIIHVAAWLAEFGLGDADGCLAFFERWAASYVTRNGPRATGTFASLEEFSASDQSHLVVGRELLDWGTRAFPSSDSPSTRAFFPTDGDSAAGGVPSKSAAPRSRSRSRSGSRSRSRSPSRSRSRSLPPPPKRSPAPTRSRRERRTTREEDEISIYSTDEEFGMQGVTFRTPGPSFARVS